MSWIIHKRQPVNATLQEALEAFENDDATKAVVMIGEIGGSAEQDAAKWASEHHALLGVTEIKLVAGRVGGSGTHRGEGMYDSPRFASPLL